MTVQQKNHKILIVDDEPNILIALEFLLQKEGYKVFKASNGDEALESAGPRTAPGGTNLISLILNIENKVSGYLLL